MAELKIKAAILHHNENIKEDGSPRMTQKTIAEKLLPHVETATAQQYVANWIHGSRTGTFKPEDVARLCEITGVDANFLFGIEPMKQ